MNGVQLSHGYRATMRRVYFLPFKSPGVLDTHLSDLGGMKD